MSIYQKKTVIASYPAYNVVTLDEIEPGFINLKSGDKIISPNHLSKFQINSVVSYALQYNEDPIKSYNDAIERGHETHYIIALGSSLTARKFAKKIYIEVAVGQKIIFEGKKFEVIAANNDNRKLKEIN